MADSVCFDRTLFVLVIIVVGALAIYNFFSYQKDIENLKTRLDSCTSMCSYPNQPSNVQTLVSGSKYTPQRINYGNNNTNNDYDDSYNNNINNNYDNNYNNNMNGNYINARALTYPDKQEYPKPITPRPPPVVKSPIPLHVPPPIPEDPVRVYDINNISNPLVYPTSRPPSYLFRPLMDNPLFFYPTRGFPDKPNYIGNLIETKLSGDNDRWEDKDKRFDRIFNKSESYHDDNDKYYRNPQLPSVLQLMGQQKYPGSSKFDYYVLLPSTGDNPPIKYVVTTDKNEQVYDGDIIKVLNRTYTVKKNRSPFEYFVP